MPQGPFLGLFRVHIKAFSIQHLYLLFLLKDADWTSYTDDNTPYVISDNISKGFFKLESTIEMIFRLPIDNQIKVNNGKCNRKKFKIQSFSNSYVKREWLNLFNYQSNIGQRDKNNLIVV